MFLPFFLFAAPWFALFFGRRAIRSHLSIRWDPNENDPTFSWCVRRFFFCLWLTCGGCALPHVRRCWSLSIFNCLPAKRMRSHHEPNEPNGRKRKRNEGETGETTSTTTDGPKIELHEIRCVCNVTVCLFVCHANQRSNSWILAGTRLHAGRPCF